jgi:CRP/FNR family cyclic AMP-dependent transcriptional regulator
MKRTRTTGRLQELRQISLFSGLSDAILESVNDVLIRHHYVPNEYIMIGGRPSHSAYFIEQGRVNVFRTSANGRKLVVARLGPGDGFNVVCCLGSCRESPANVCALTPVKAIAIAQDDLRQLLLRYPDLAFAVLNHLADRLKHLTALTEMLGLLSTRGRLARFILDHADDAGLIYWHCTQEDIAARLGTVKDVVGRTLRGFADEGLIELPTRHCILIRDAEGLAIEAQQ